MADDGDAPDAAPATADTGPHGGTVCVLDPDPYLEVTVKPGVQDVDELHLHPAGQGFWIARIAARVGADVTLVARSRRSQPRERQQA